LETTPEFVTHIDVWKTDQALSLRLVQEWLLTQEQVEYSQGGISLLFKRLKIKLKPAGPPMSARTSRAWRILKKLFTTNPILLSASDLL